jgi:tyrosinase
MNVEIRFPGYDGQGRTFLTWRPVEVSLKLVGAAGAADVPVTLSAKTLPGGGRLAFADRLTHQGTPSLNVTLAANGTLVKVWVGGAFPDASTTYGDVTMEVRETASSQLLGDQPTMVRVRKNANGLSALERDRFLSALATLNGGGNGPYKDFRDMHVGGPPDDEAHRGPGFLPWHRAYLLDFERELQAIDGDVTLPYWRFDQAAPNVINRAFMGTPDVMNWVRFNAGHPLLGWVALGQPGIQRGRGVGPLTVPALRSEAQTLRVGPNLHADFSSFRGMQGNPHGSAHNSHQGGWIMVPAQAPRDPLFFLLHNNVDRLWAKWQWAAQVHDPNDPRSFVPSGTSIPGHRLADRLWPWSGPLPAPRPTTAPGGPLAASSMAAAPGGTPRIRDMIDYFGIVSGAHQAFAYDDVPFQN